MKITCKISVLVLLSIIILANTCEERPHYDDRLVFINKTGNEVFILKSEMYPDTTIPKEQPLITYDVIIKPNSKKAYPNNINWEDNFMQLTSDTIVFFLFNLETIDNTLWEEICDNYVILKRYDLSLEDLQGMNWTITYP